MAGYVELHAHSCWSLREGASSTDEMVERALALGYPALAMTDHDNLYGAMEFARAAKERGLRPITGCELTLSDGSHLTVLTETVEGYRNLCRLLSRAHHEYGKDEPRTERAWFAELGEGLIVLSGCKAGELARLIDEGEQERALALVRWWLEAVGEEGFYVELQHHDVFGDTERVARLAAVAQKAGARLVATNNAHYHVRERHRLNDVLVATRHRLTLDSSHAVRRANSEFYLKPSGEMAERFGRWPEAVANTVEIAARCGFDITEDLPYRLPDYPRLPEGETEIGYLRRICERAFERKYPAVRPRLRTEAEGRLGRELRLIEKHGLTGFFLVYREILEIVGEIARELHGRDPSLAPEERPVGRGRGSSVSSIVCYLIGLSHIDPVQNNLYLDRFLNEELHSLPDIDLDFPRDIRDELLQRIYDHFGEEHAALVAAFPTYRFKNAVGDVGKALGLPAPMLAKLSKLGGAGMFGNAKEVGRELEQIPELRGLANSKAWYDLAELCSQLAGFPRHISQHVGGVVISSEPISSVVPVEPARMEGRLVCQWDKDSVDDARFVKIDFLALGMLSAVDECLEIVEETRGKRVDLGRIDHDDPLIYASIKEGDTMGVFQIESRAQIQTLPKTQPKNLEDLAVQVAIIRPGPIVAGAMHPYMEGRERFARGEAIAIDYGHPELAGPLEDVLGETLGHVLYQDQVIQVACAVAGFTPGQADRLRRAMSRKRSSEAMQALEGEFYAGAEANGVGHEAAAVAFEKMAAFAAFGFPKSHAVAFALLAYESAWLRYFYPAAFYCSLFNAQPMGFYSVEVLTGDAKRHGIEVRLPGINESRTGAWPEADDVIRLGLQQVHGLGGGWRRLRDKTGKAKRIVEEREAKGPYRSLYDLVTRARLRQDEAEALIRADTLREFGLPRRELLWQLGLLVPQPGQQAALPLPVEEEMAELPGMKPWEELSWDFELMGVGRQHPMALVRPYLHEGMVTSLHIGGIRNQRRLPQGTPVTVAGMVVTRQRPSTANGVIFMLLEDEFGLVNVVVYTNLSERNRELVRATPFVVIRGTIENEKSGMPNVIARSIERCPLPGQIEAPEAHNWG